MLNESQESSGISSQRPLEENYWDSLLSEGEFAHAVTPDEPILETEPTPPFAEVNPQGLQDVPLTDIDADWSTVADIMDADGVLELKVVGYNKGGLLVEWHTLRGFVPASQLMRFPATSNENKRREALVNRVGDMLALRVIELDKEKNRLIFSERAAQVAAGTRDHILEMLSPGDIVQGTVTNLCDFGAFIDLGGVEGLIHISELSWGRVGHPADILTRQQEIDVYVIEVDPSDTRIALSLKRLTPDPWETVDTRYEVGEVVEGKITNVVDFGAFACIEEGLEGLIHFSELAEGHFLHPRNVVQEGETVQARILSIDGKARRLGLSLRLL